MVAKKSLEGQSVYHGHQGQGQHVLVHFDKNFDLCLEESIDFDCWSQAWQWKAFPHPQELPEGHKEEDSQCSHHHCQAAELDSACTG